MSNISSLTEGATMALALALQYNHHAEFAAFPRQAIADGYSAIDAAFSALLVERNIEPPRNHKKKMALVRSSFSSVFDSLRSRQGNGWRYSPGVSWDRLESFYYEWLRARYEEFAMTAIEARARVEESHAAVSCAVRYLAQRSGVSADELEAETLRIAFGYQYSEAQSAVAEAHERRFSEAEMIGEIYGSRLGTKLAETSNYCNLDINASDEVTRKIIETDADVANECAELYERFMHLVEHIHRRRSELLLDTSTVEEADCATDYMLALKIRYHGGKLSEIGSRWGKTLAQAFSDFSHNS